MAAESTQDRNQPASAKRRKEFRDRGETGLSREVSTAVLMLTAAAAVALMGGDVASRMGQIMQSCIEDAGHGSVLAVFGSAISDCAGMLLPLFAVLVLIGALAFVAQGEVTFSLKVLKPKLERLNPLARIKQLFFSLRSLTELLKGLLKVALLGALTAWFIRDQMPMILQLNNAGPSELTGFFSSTAVWLAAGSAFALAVLAILDRLYQHHDIEKRMKMTRQEAKEEHKEQEGDPTIKSRRRQRHRELSLNHIIAEVPKADVVVTNPTHFAVALRYDRTRDPSPRVVAKGQDQLALKIRSIARVHGIPIMEQRTLARSLFRTVRVGKVIRPEFFQAVAEVYAFLFRRGREAEA